MKTLTEQLNTTKKGEKEEGEVRLGRGWNLEANFSISIVKKKGDVTEGTATLFLGYAALQKSESDVGAMKKQAENLTVEYDRLLDEHSKLLVHTHTHKRYRSLRSRPVNCVLLRSNKISSWQSETGHTLS